MKKFIVTKDKNTAEVLLKMGFRAVSKNGDGTEVFLNEGKVNFEKKDLKFTYSDILTI